MATTLSLTVRDLAQLEWPRLQPNVENAILSLAQEALTISVGHRIAKGLSDHQLDEFKDVLTHGDDEALRWLLHNVPKNEAVVMEEYTRLLAWLAGLGEVIRVFNDLFDGSRLTNDLPWDIDKPLAGAPSEELSFKTGSVRDPISE